MNLVVCNYFVFAEMQSWKDVGAESHSASQPGLGKPSSTPEMSARDAEVMANAMLLDSPLPNLESDED